MKDVIMLTLLGIFLAGGAVLTAIAAKAAFFSSFGRKQIFKDEGNPAAFAYAEVAERNRVLQSRPRPKIHSDIATGEGSYYIWDQVAPTIRQELQRTPELKVRIITGPEVWGKITKEGTLANDLFSLADEFQARVQIMAAPERRERHFILIDNGKRIFLEMEHDSKVRPQTLSVYNNSFLLGSELSSWFETTWSQLEGSPLPTLKALPQDILEKRKNEGYKV